MYIKVRKRDSYNLLLNFSHKLKKSVFKVVKKLLPFFSSCAGQEFSRCECGLFVYGLHVFLHSECSG